MGWEQDVTRLLAEIAPVAGSVLGGNTGHQIGEGLKTIGHHQANQAEANERNARIDNFDPRKTGLTDSQAQNNNIRAGQNAQQVSNLSNVNNVANTAAELMRNNPGLDPVRAGKLANDMADTAARSQQQMLQSQQSFVDVRDNANANRSTQRDLIKEGVNIAAKNVADQLTNLQAARNSNNNLLLGASSGNIR